MKKNVFIEGEIGKSKDTNPFVVAKEIRDAVRDKATQINVFLNSVGGSVNEGWCVVSAMNYAKENNVTVRTIADGAVFSMGSVIFANGDKRETKNYSRGMIHSPYFADEKELTEEAKAYIAGEEQKLLTLYSNVMNIDESQILAMMKAETYMSAKEMKAFGIATEITGEENSKISALYSNFGGSELVAKIKEVKNKENTNNKTNNMSEVTADIVARLDSLEKGNKTLAQENEALAKRVKQAEEQSLSVVVADIVAKKQLAEGETFDTQMETAKELGLDKYKAIAKNFPDKEVKEQFRKPEVKGKSGNSIHSDGKFIGMNAVLAKHGCSSRFELRAKHEDEYNKAVLEEEKELEALQAEKEESWINRFN